jgi:hypothetical protein
MKIIYSSNNSGGRWWLKDDDWYALEAAGWIVNWYKDIEDGLFGTYKDGRFLDALASEARLLLLNSGKVSLAKLQPLEVVTVMDSHTTSHSMTTTTSIYRHSM